MWTVGSELNGTYLCSNTSLFQSRYVRMSYVPNTNQRLIHVNAFKLIVDIGPESPWEVIVTTTSRLVTKQSEWRRFDEITTRSRSDVVTTQNMRDKPLEMKQDWIDETDSTLALKTKNSFAVNIEERLSYYQWHHGHRTDCHRCVEFLDVISHIATQCRHFMSDAVPHLNTHNGIKHSKWRLSRRMLAINTTINVENVVNVVFVLLLDLQLVSAFVCGNNRTLAHVNDMRLSSFSNIAR